MVIPKPVYLLHTKIHPVTSNQVLLNIKEAITKNKQLIIFPINIHILVELSKHPNFRPIHEKADIIFTDGVPLIWLSSLYKQNLPERVSGTDLVENLLLSKKFRIFLLGSKIDNLKKIVYKYNSAQNFPICGFHSPPIMERWSQTEVNKINQLIILSRANIILVGVGPLKQERFISTDLKINNRKIVIGVGSAFDILSGSKIRAPKIMQWMGLEWLWRLILEPKRLTARYIYDALFMLKIILIRR
jgi:N-acetylglucosaminyldiphosphoundecaprenol N-acetyl-beta-D-mannosaminyltransferase